MDETMIPLSVLASRFEKHRDEMRRELRLVPWWRWRRRRYLEAAAGVYEYELNELLRLGGGVVMARLKKSA
jgi:hypothetical protein